MLHLSNLKNVLVVPLNVSHLYEYDYRLNWTTRYPVTNYS